MIIQHLTGLLVSSQSQYLSYFSRRTLKASLKMINPVFITLIGAIIVTFAITLTYYPPGTTTQPEPINPFQGENPSDPIGTAGISLLNALIYVSIVLIGGLIFVFLLKFGFSRIIEVIVGLSMGFSAFLFTMIILPAFLIPFFKNFDFLIPILLGSTQSQVNNSFEALIFLLAFLIAIIYVFGLIFNKFKNQHLHNTLMILFGISMGSIFGIFFETVSLIVVLIALALYDIYAVFRGPLKSMFDNLNEQTEHETFNQDINAHEQAEQGDLMSYESSQRNSTSYEFSSSEISNIPSEKEAYVRIPSQTQQNLRKGISLPIYSTPYISIGLGDFVFFSVLIAKATYFAIKGGDLFLAPTIAGSVYWGLILLPLLGVLVGSYLTFVYLQKYEVLPALPFPIFCGLIGLFLSVSIYYVL